VTVAKAFLSGARDHNPGVDQLVDQLRVLGYQASTDAGLAGDRRSWEKALREISECDVFIPVISRASADSVFARREFDWAERLAKPVLPVVVEPPANALPVRFLRYPIVDYSHPAQHDRSASMLSGALASLPPAPPLPHPLPQPPPAPRSAAARKRIGVGATCVLAIAVAAALLTWLTAILPFSNANATKLIQLNDGVFIGSPHAATTIDVFVDPICTTCERFVVSSGGDLQRAVNDKKIAVRYHLLNFENDQSASGDYSTRAIAASICVADTNDPDRYKAFYAGLFAPDFQPKKKDKKVSTDRTDAELAGLAQTAGAPSSVNNCITSGQRVDAAKDEASKAEASLKRLLGTVTMPMIFEGTREVDYANTGWIDTLR
jgi:protein-disulfide isomerase